MLNKNFFTANIKIFGNGGHSAYMPAANYKPLYNGNISSMAVSIDKFNQPLLYNYGYDQLNRIVSMDAFEGLDQANNNWSALNKISEYQERIGYDANGNVQTGLRNGSSTQLALEDFQYHYDAVKKEIMSILNAPEMKGNSNLNKANSKL